MTSVIDTLVRDNNIREIEDQLKSNRLNLLELLIAASKRSDRITIMQLALQYGADVNGRIAKRTPLEVSVEAKNIDGLLLLLSNRANPNVRYQNHMPPLTVAVILDSVEMTKILLDFNADVNVNTNAAGERRLSALHVAVNPILIRLLLDRGADMNLEDLYGITPLVGALRRGGPDIIAPFLERITDWQQLCDIVTNIETSTLKDIVKSLPKSDLLRESFKYEATFDNFNAYVNQLNKEQLCKGLSYYYVVSQCANKTDTITQDDFGESVIGIGQGDHRQCYDLEGLFDYYDSQVNDNKPFRDPNTRASITDEEINDLKRRIRLRRPHVVMPQLQPPPAHLILNEVMLTYEHLDHQANFFKVFILDNANHQAWLDLGLIPAQVEPEHTNSTNLTSAVVLSNLHRLWDLNRLLVSVDPLVCCTVHLRRSVEYWYINDTPHIDLNKFVAMAREIEDLL